MRLERWGAHISTNVRQNFLKGLSGPSKKIVVKSGKRAGPVRKDYHRSKGRAVKFHKSSLIFWAKAVSKPKNKQKSAPATQSVGITDLEITSILL